jgi:hypothetical protein
VVAIRIPRLATNTGGASGWIACVNDSGNPKIPEECGCLLRSNGRSEGALQDIVVPD